MSFFESAFGGLIRYVQEREEFRKWGLFLLLGILLWITAFVLVGKQQELTGRIELKERRFRDLVEVVRTFKAQPEQENAVRSGLPGDPLTVLSRLLEKVGIKDRLVQLSSASSGVSMQVERLYPGELGTLLQEVIRQGLPIMSCEIRAVPSGNERRLSCSLLVGGKVR